MYDWNSAIYKMDLLNAAVDFRATARTTQANYSYYISNNKKSAEISALFLVLISD
jgi:hypothetical protein